MCLTRHLKSLGRCAALSAGLCVALAAPLAAKPPLDQVAEIDDGLMMVAIADELRKSCDDISARMIRAYSVINALKSRAHALGYSDAEIEDYTSSRSQKARMRAKAEAWLAGQGVDRADKARFCAFGRQEIARGTAIGMLLR